MTKQAAIQTFTYLCTSPTKKFTQCENKNKGSNIHKPNVMTHQTVQQTELCCHILPVVLFVQFGVYMKKTQRPGGPWRSRQYVDGTEVNMRINWFLMPFFHSPELCNMK